MTRDTTSSVEWFGPRGALPVVRSCILGVFATVVIILLARFEGTIEATLLSFVAAGLTLTLIARIWRSGIAVSDDALFVRGILVSHKIRREALVMCDVTLSWKLWQRLLVPVTLVLKLHSGRVVQVSGVQSYVSNFGVVGSPAKRLAETSYPQLVAQQINERYGIA